MSAAGPPQGARATYTGRFAPSPTGPLHAGSLVAALASWLDARAHGGVWLVRIEDVDTPRTITGATEHILAQLSACGLESDGIPLLQSARAPLYQQALDRLVAKGLAYPCTCSRKTIAAAWERAGQRKARHGELVYPGTCRPSDPSPPGTHRSAPQPPCAWRLRTDFCIQKEPLALVNYNSTAIKHVANQDISWDDRQLGTCSQHVTLDVGDFVLKRADGCFTYQLAVVVDDAAQGVTHVVRGMDLADNTARQILLQRALDYPTPHYLHTPLVLGINGEKLSKQNGAMALDTSSPKSALRALCQAAQVLGLAVGTAESIPAALAGWTSAWRTAHGPT